MSTCLKEALKNLHREELKEEIPLVITIAKDLKEAMKDLHREKRQELIKELGVPIEEMAILLDKTRKLEYDIIGKYRDALETSMWEMSGEVRSMVMYPNLPLSYKQENREEWNKLCIDCRRFYKRLLEIEPDPATAEIEENRVLDERMRLAVSRSALPPKI